MKKYLNRLKKISGRSAEEKYISENRFIQFKNNLNYIFNGIDFSHRKFFGPLNFYWKRFCNFLSRKITDLRTKSLSEKCLPAVTFTICNMQNRNGYSDIIDIL